MTELTHRMRTCAAHLRDAKEPLSLSRVLAVHDAVDLLTEAADALDAGAPPQAEPSPAPAPELKLDTSGPGREEIAGISPRDLQRYQGRQATAAEQRARYQAMVANPFTGSSSYDARLAALLERACSRRTGYQGDDSVEYDR